MATEYLTNATDLKAVADAIRTKAGSTAQLAFPDGFISAVNGIQTGGGEGQQPATMTIKTIGTPQHTTATMSYIDVNGVWKTSQIDYTNDVVVNTMIKGVVTINITPFSAFGITNVSGCNRYALQTYNPPFVQAFYITDSNATVTFYSSD